MLWVCNVQKGKEWGGFREFFYGETERERGSLFDHVKSLDPWRRYWEIRDPTVKRIPSEYIILLSWANHVQESWWKCRGVRLSEGGKRKKIRRDKYYTYEFSFDVGGKRSGMTFRRLLIISSLFRDFVFQSLPKPLSTVRCLLSFNSRLFSACVLIASSLFGWDLIRISSSV